MQPCNDAGNHLVAAPSETVHLMVGTKDAAFSFPVAERCVRQVVDEPTERKLVAWTALISLSFEYSGASED